METRELKKPANWFKNTREEIISHLKSASIEGDFTPRGVVRILRKCLRKDDIVVADVGINKEIIAKDYPVFTPNYMPNFQWISKQGYRGSRRNSSRSSY